MSHTYQSIIQSYTLTLNIQVGVQGLQILKPRIQKNIPSSVVIGNGVKEFTDTVGGVGLEVRLILCEENVEDETTNWEVENLKFSVPQPVMRIIDLITSHCLSFIRWLCVMLIFPCRLKQLLRRMSFSTLLFCVNLKLIQLAG
jgi:hypothetical protein